MRPLQLLTPGQGLVAGVADELACEINDRELYISLRVEMAWGTRPRAAIKIVARPREHHVKRVYATAIVVLLVPQCAAGCDRVVLNDSRHDVHSRRIVTKVSRVRCACRGEHALQQLRKALIESSIGGKVRRGPDRGSSDRIRRFGEASALVRLGSVKGVDLSKIVIVKKEEPKPEENLKWLAVGGPEKPPAKSKPGSFLIITFQNKSNQDVKLYWVDYGGGKKLYGEISKGAERKQNTYSDAVWLVTDNKDKPLGYFVAGTKMALAVIPK